MMKLVLLSALVAVALADVSHLARNSGSGLRDAQANILRQDSDISPEGSYQWSYETDNGIQAQEQASIRVLGPEQSEKSAQGSASWTSPEGEQIQLTYVADANGYQPQGSHLPTPPPIPVAIQRALEWIAAHPAPIEHNANRYSV